MIVGMIGSAAVFLTAVGMTADEALRQHAVSFVVLQAFGMTVAIVAWMRHVVTRGEVLAMAAAMIVPAVALIRLRLVGIIGGPICGVWRWCSSPLPTSRVWRRRGGSTRRLKRAWHRHKKGQTSV
jgi:hypothetical protein